MDQIEHKTGVYVIYCKANGKVYVGGGYVSVEYRLGTYKRDLPRGLCHNVLLQRAWDKYGSEAFEFNIEVFCAPERVQTEEQLRIDFYEATNRDYGFNICPIAGSTLGSKPELSDEVRAALAESARTRLNTPEVRAKKIRYLKSEEARRKNSEAHKGVPCPTKGKTYNEIYGEGLAAIMRTNVSVKLLGRKCSEETKAKMSESGKKRHMINPLTDEARAKITASNKGRVRSDEFKRKLSLAHKGRKRGPTSIETRKKISAVIKQWWSERKGVVSACP